MALHRVSLQLVDLTSGEIIKTGKRSTADFQNLTKTDGSILCDSWYARFKELVATGRNLSLQINCDEYTPLTELSLFEDEVFSA